MGARVLTLFFCLSMSALGLSVPTRAADSTESSLPQTLPQTVVVKSDMVFYVPFSVTRDVVNVAAGTEVLLKGLQGRYLKLAYGPAEMTVDAAATDFAERLAQVQQPLPEAIQQTTPPQIQQSLGAARAPQSAVAKNPYTQPSSIQKSASASRAASSQPGIHAPVQESSSSWLGYLFVLVLMAAGVVGIVVMFARSGDPYSVPPTSPPPLPSSVRLDLRDAGNLSPFEIGEYLDALDWYQLEKLTAALFEAKGSWVETRGGAKADGGIDMVVGFNGAKAAVQCKHWGKWHCGPAVVRELVGAMAIEKIPRGFLICRSATEAAESVAARNSVTIVQRAGLIDRIAEALYARNGEVRTALTQPQKLCPKCGAAMALRSASKGPNAGSQFWGCSTYPKCRQTMKV